MSRSSEPDAAELYWSCTAEQSVLGGLLLDNDAAARIADVVDGGSFWSGAHRLIFEAIGRLIAMRAPADVVTVYQALQDAGHGQEVASLQHLNALAQSVPSAANIRRYAEIVADKSLQRRLIAAAGAAPEIIAEAESADEALDRMQSKLAALRRVQQRGVSRPLHQLMAERLSAWQSLASGDSVPGIPTGLASIDQALGGGLKRGRVVVLAARPSVGKTSLATQILLHVAGQGYRVLMLSQEMTAGELADRVAANLGAAPLDHISTGQLVGDEWAQAVEVVERASALPAFIDDQPALTLLDIRAKAREVQRGGGLALLVVDYLQLCSSAGGFDKRHHQIEQISRGIKALAKELDVCVLLLSQLKRDQGEPELDHLKESGSIEEDADVVVLLHPVRKEPDGLLLIAAKVAKNRGGRRGRLALSFDGRRQQWAPSTSDVSPRRSAEGATR